MIENFGMGSLSLAQTIYLTQTLDGLFKFLAVFGNLSGVFALIALFLTYGNLVKKEDIVNLVEKKDLENLATKQSLEHVATKESMEHLPTKESLAHLATKESLPHLATKKNLEHLASGTPGCERKCPPYQRKC